MDNQDDLIQKNEQRLTPRVVKDNYEPMKREKIWQEYWEKEGVYHFNPESEQPLFTIDTPPPTISGQLHMGHVYSYTQAEIFARFERLNGKNVRYSFGLDNNGLPTERLVEKEIGKKADKMELSEFIFLCEKITKVYTEKYNKLWKSLGLSVDWRLEYSTISEEVQKLAQSTFRELYERGLIYKKEAPSLYCIECQTSFAQAEKENMERKSIFFDIAFTLEDGKELLIATTRPELLPACVAVFVHPGDERYKGLAGKKVKTPLGESVKIMLDEKVDKDKGTGAVMCCTYGDETDIFWAKKHNLEEKIIINNNGRFKENNLIGELEGMNIQQARKKIVELLDAKGVIRKKEKVKQVVDVHERCGTPVEYLSTVQWFMKLLDKKEELIEAGKKINWHPEYMKKRYEEWVNGLKWDWCISRERFYGIPIPAYSCNNCEYVELAKESEMPIDPKANKNKKECPKCANGILEPEKTVLDTWFTSALSPEINNQDKHNGRLKGKLLPMTMRPQGHDIIRTWALYTILMSLYRNNDIPWNDLIISGHLLMRKGEKISKKTGGGQFRPEELIEKYSADAVRYAMTGASLGRDSYLDEKEIKKGKRLVTKIYNAGKLILANLTDYDTNKKIDFEDLENLDKWIIYRSQEVRAKMAEYGKSYDYTHARTEFESFFWSEFCDNYLEMIKKRISISTVEISSETSKKRLSAQYASYHSFLNILKIISPYMPHIAEEMYHGKMVEKIEGDEKQLFFLSAKENNLFAVKGELKSVTTTRWPEFENNIDDSIKKAIQFSFEIISDIRKYRANNNLRFSLPITEVTISCKKENIDLIKKLEEDIKTATKVEHFNYVETDNSKMDILIKSDK